MAGDRSDVPKGGRLDILGPDSVSGEVPHSWQMLVCPESKAQGAGLGRVKPAAVCGKWRWDTGVPNAWFAYSRSVARKRGRMSVIFTNPVLVKDWVVLEISENKRLRVFGSVHASYRLSTFQGAIAILACWAGLGRFQGHNE